MKFHKLFEEEPEPVEVDTVFGLTLPERILGTVLALLIVGLFVVAGGVGR